MSQEQLTRRECLSRGAGAVLAAGAAAIGGYLLYDPQGDAGLPKPGRKREPLKNYFAQVDFPAAGPRISVAVGHIEPPTVRARPVTGGPDPTGAAPIPRIETMVRAAVGGLDPTLGMRRFVGPGDTVLIKPNVGFDRPPQFGATTHPEVLRWVIRLCKEAGARRVLITDNPIESPAACFARTGIQRVANEEGARVVLPAENRFRILPLLDRGLGSSPGGWPILYQPLAEATKLIGVAPIKDHNLAGGSMVLKNWYGLLGGRRNQLHQAIHEAISNLALALSPTLVVADATRVMMSNGPTGGRLTDLKPGGELGRPAVIAAVDPVACDAWCFQNLLGRDPARLTYLDLAEQKIQTQVAGGENRLGRRDWQTYERQGLIVTTDV
jgi:uncharacterized protein (DUF362 family)